MFRLLKIRPPNGWGAVAWELLIVTVGVLLALAAQQWADGRALANKVAAADRALRAEIAYHYYWAVEWRQVQPCIDAQIAALSERLERSGARLEPAPMLVGDSDQRFVLRIPSKEYSTSAWDSALGEGLASEFGRERQLDLSNYYEQVAIIKDHGAKNGADQRRLNVLSRPIPLDPGVRYLLVERLEELRARAQFDVLLSGQLIDNITRLGLVPDAAETRRQVERWGTFKHCRAQRLPMRSLADASRPVAN